MTGFDVRVSVHTHSPGDLLLRRQLSPELRVTVLEAAQEILISDATLAAVAHGGHFALPNIRLVKPTSPKAVGWAGWFLHVDTDDQHLVYKITTYDHTFKAWSAGWPD